MAVQTTFGFSPAEGVIGSLYDAESVTDSTIVSKTAAAATKFGRGVYTAAATPNVAAVPTSTATAARLVGVTVEDRTKASQAGYAAGDQMRVLKKGCIRVYFETDMADLGTVYCRIITDTDGSDLGQFRKDNASGKAVICTNARFRAVNGPLTGAGIGVLELGAAFGSAGATV